MRRRMKALVSLLYCVMIHVRWFRCRPLPRRFASPLLLPLLLPLALATQASMYGRRQQQYMKGVAHSTALAEDWGSSQQPFTAAAIAAASVAGTALAWHCWQGGMTMP